MKSMLKKIVLIWASLLALAGISKKDEQEKNSDAILFPEMTGKNVVEDYEIAAYHQQA